MTKKIKGIIKDKEIKNILIVIIVINLNKNKWIHKNKDKKVIQDKNMNQNKK